MRNGERRPGFGRVSCSLSYCKTKLHFDMVITEFVCGREFFTALPKKSGCQPCVFDDLRSCSSSIAVVVSPLLPLTRDQVESRILHEARTGGVSAAIIKSESECL